MRYLIPFPLDQLGAPEILWLLLAFGGLSLLVPLTRPRWKVALAVAACLAIYVWADAATQSSQATGVQRLLLVAVGVAVVGIGHLRPVLTGRPWAVPAWVGALVAVSVALRPFGLHPVEDAAAWGFLAFLFGGLAYGLSGRPRRGALVAAFCALFLLLCGLARPFGLSWGGGVAILVAAGVLWAVASQGKELRTYVRRRIVGTPIVLLLLITISFFLIRAAPGGPFDTEKPRPPEVQARLEAEHHLDKPLVVQYGLYLGKLVWEGNLGISYKQMDRTVNEIVATHIGPSAVLGLTALLLALLIGMTAGLVSGIRRNSIFDYVSMAIAMVGLAVPTFVVGPMLVLVFAMHLGWFEVTGWGTLKDLVLPAITLSLPFAARVARLTRAGMLEVVHQDYIRTARAKGLSERTIVIRHTLKGALIPVVSFLGPAVAQMLTGSLVVELIFQVPGLGTEFVQSALNRDYFLVLGLVLTFGTLLIVFTLLVDVLYAFLDPRIRHG